MTSVGAGALAEELGQALGQLRLDDTGIGGPALRGGLEDRRARRDERAARQRELRRLGVAVLGQVGLVRVVVRAARLARVGLGGLAFQPAAGRSESLTLIAFAFAWTAGTIAFFGRARSAGEGRAGGDKQRGRRRRRASRRLLQQAQNLAVLGPAADALLGEDRLAVAHDVELRLRAPDGRGRDPGRLELGRETRGPCVVAVSDGAVEDLDRHGATAYTVGRWPRPSVGPSISPPIPTSS